MVVAALVPTLAIWVLSRTQSTSYRILYIGGFTALFAVLLMFLGEQGLTRLQIFTATSA